MKTDLLMAPDEVQDFLPHKCNCKKPSLGGGIKKLQAQLNEINKVNAPLIATPVTFDLSFLNKPVVTK